MKHAKMVSTRSFAFITTHPISYSIEANKPISLPATHFKDALAAGMRFVEEEEVAKTLEPQKPVEVSLDDREDVLNKAFAALIDENDAQKFTGTGIPSAAAVLALTTVKLSQKDIAVAWDKYKIAKEQSK